MELEKVSAKNKIVTDKQVIKKLEYQGIDKDYVEFHNDYSGEFPFSKTYKDLKTDKRIMVISQNPHFRSHDNIRIELGWIEKNGIFTNKPNLFNATITGTKIHVDVIDDSYGSGNTGDFSEWNPDLYIGEDLIEPISENPIILSVDPKNKEYINNTLEWNYGVCKRRVRLIYGYIREKWFFDEKPKDDIKIVHNHSGNIKLNMGSGTNYEFNTRIHPVGMNVKVIDNDIEFLELKYINSIPFEINASPETYFSSADASAYVDNNSAYLSWTDIRNHIGESSDNGSAYMLTHAISTNLTATDKFRWMGRGMFAFYTAALPDDCVVTSASLELYAYTKFNTATGWTNDFCIVEADLASSTDVEGGDYNSVGDVAWSEVVNTSWSEYKSIELNSTGISNISLIGYTEFGTRNNTHDRLNSEPAWSADVGAWQTVRTTENGVGRPKLIVTYDITPTLTTFNLDNSNTNTYDTKLLLVPTVTNSPTEFIASESASFASGPGWQDFSPYPYIYITIADYTGNHTVYFKVRNSAGESNVLSDTIIYVKVPTVTTQAATNIAGLSAQLNGTLVSTNGENVSIWGFNYGKTSAMELSPITTTSNPGTGTFLQTPTLEADTLYYFQAKCYNSAGWGVGAVESFTTHQVIEEPASVTLGLDVDNTYVVAYLKSIDVSLGLDAQVVSTIPLYDGDLADIQNFDTTLTAEQALYLYQTGNAPFVINRDNLKGYWKLDKYSSSGLVLEDSSGNENDGTSANLPVYTFGRFPSEYDGISANKAVFGVDYMTFDGTSDLISIGVDMIEDKDISVSAWIYPTGAGEGGYGRVLDNGSFVLNLTATGTQLELSSDATVTSALSASSSITLNTWNHVVITRESDGTVNFYVDGTISGTTDQDSGTPEIATTNLIIGNDSGATRTFAGNMKNIRIFNRILTADEVSTIYNSEV